MSLFAKEWVERRKALTAHRRDRWLGLHSAAAGLVAVFNKLEGEDYYRFPSGPQVLEDSHNPALPSITGDFWELWHLRGDQRVYDNLDCKELAEELDASRGRSGDVRRVRRRMCHQLNKAADVLYVTGRYLAFAHRLRRDLAEDASSWRPPRHAVVLECLSQVGDQLQGLGGAGILREQQASIGESLWLGAHASTFVEFRERLLAPVGWEQFTGLFRFFVHFHRKRQHEVLASAKALEALCKELGSVLASAGIYVTQPAPFKPAPPGVVG